MIVAVPNGDDEDLPRLFPVINDVRKAAQNCRPYPVENLSVQERVAFDQSDNTPQFIHEPIAKPGSTRLVMR